jgi:hypothetical protein
MKEKRTDLLSSCHRQTAGKLKINSALHSSSSSNPKPFLRAVLLDRGGGLWFRLPES